MQLFVADVPRRAPPRRQCQHDETERDHRQSHEFKSKRVHGNVPPTDRYNCREGVEGLLSDVVKTGGFPAMVDGRLRSEVNGGRMIATLGRSELSNKPAAGMTAEGRPAFCGRQGNELDVTMRQYRS